MARQMTIMGEVTAHWQPSLFPWQPADAIVYEKVKRKSYADKIAGNQSL